MFLFSPIGNYALNKQRVYGKLLEYIRQMNRPILINSIVLSEFVNANLRKEYEIWKIKPENSYTSKYKEHFLKSSVYNNTIKAIIAATRSILTIATKGNDDFNAISLDNVFNEMSHCDFNDAYYLQYAALKKYIIVTDDADLFKNNKSGISIITYNP